MTIAFAKANLPYRPFAENFADKTLDAPPSQPARGNAHVFGRADGTTGKNTDPLQSLRDMLREKPHALAHARGVQVADVGYGFGGAGSNRAALWGAGLLAVTLVAALAAAGGPAGVVTLGSGLAKGWTLYLGAGLGILGLTSAFGDILTIPFDTVSTLVGYLLGKETPTEIGKLPELVLESANGQRINLIELLERQQAPQQTQRMLEFFSNHKISGIEGLPNLTPDQYYDRLIALGLSHNDAMIGTFQAMTYSYNNQHNGKNNFWKSIPNPLQFLGEKLNILNPSEIFDRMIAAPKHGRLMDEEREIQPPKNLGVPLDVPNQDGKTVRQIAAELMRSGMGSMAAYYAAAARWTGSYPEPNNWDRPDPYKDLGLPPPNYSGEPLNDPGVQDDPYRGGVTDTGNEDLNGENPDVYTEP